MIKHFTNTIFVLAVAASFALTVGCAASQHRDEVDRSPTRIAVSNSDPTPSGEQETANTDKASPDEVVRQFLTWYLKEVRDGEEPSKNTGKLRQYLTADYIAKLTADALPDFDPILMLPKPESEWSNMTVKAGKPTFYNKRGLHDAYVDVTYTYTSGRAVKDEWVIGLDKTSAGWRIVSIGIGDV